MIVKKPTILIYTKDADRDFLREICAGIEEEGALYEEVAQASSDCNQLAWQAANDSMLGTGIAICKQTIVLQMKGLPREKPICAYYMPTFKQCRNLGANSARAMKRSAFKLEEDE